MVAGNEETVPERQTPPKLINFRVQVARIDDPSKVVGDDDMVGVLDVQVQVPDRFLPSGHDRSGDGPVFITLQSQIRTALEAARPSIS